MNIELIYLVVICLLVMMFMLAQVMILVAYWFERKSLSREVKDLVRILNEMSSDAHRESE